MKRTYEQLLQALKAGNWSAASNYGRDLSEMFEAGGHLLLEGKDAAVLFEFLSDACLDTVKQEKSRER